MKLIVPGLFLVSFTFLHCATWQPVLDHEPVDHDRVHVSGPGCICSGDIAGVNISCRSVLSKEGGWLILRQKEKDEDGDNITRLWWLSRTPSNRLRLMTDKRKNVTGWQREYGQTNPIPTADRCSNLAYLLLEMRGKK